MSRRGLAALLGLAAGVSVLLGGCSYDYLQHTDRVAFSAGNAVRANLEAETTNPSKRSLYSTKGLGRNGHVVPATATDSSAPASSGSTAATTVGSP